jgi:predicted RNase H-like HicB family nuclease
MIYLNHMNTTISVTLTHDEKAKTWGAWIPDVPAYGVGKTPQLAMDDLKKAVALYIEEVGKKRFLEEIAAPTQTLSVPLSILV